MPKLSAEQWEDLIITAAMLLGGEPRYDDYGHPERAHVRQYWSVRMPGGPDAYGYTRSQAAERWLLKKGICVDKHGNIKKCIPHSYLSYLEK